jgi:hypothetical protein
LVEQHIREEVIEPDHDDGGEREPDRGEDWSGGEELLHGRNWERKELTTLAATMDWADKL